MVQALSSPCYSITWIRGNGGGDCQGQGSCTAKNSQIYGWKSYRDKTRIGHTRWQPRKRLAWEQMEEMRDLKAQYPHVWTVSRLGQVFCVSQAAVMKILKSKFVPSEAVRGRQDEKALRQKAERKPFYKKKQDSD